MVLIALNGFFVAGEFSLVAVNRSRVESRAEEGDRRASSLLRRIRKLSFELSGAQLGITVTSLIVGAIAEPTVAELLKPVFSSVGIDSRGVAIGTALVLATVAQMVLGELFPKNVAIARPYRTAVMVGLPMGMLNALLRPVIRLFNSSANWAVRLIGIEPRDELAGLRSLQELEMMVRASSAEGELDEQETSLLTRAIAFGEKDAADAMVPRVSVLGLPVESTVAELRSLSVSTGHSRFPVYEDDLDDVVKIVHVKDTFGMTPEQLERTRVVDLEGSLEVVPETMRLDSVLIELQKTGRSMAVVVDEYGGTAGIVTVEDILEELLGEIEDEYDDAAVVTSPAGILSGALHRHEVEEITGFEWPEGNYETLSGFVTAQLDRFPEPGDVVSCGGYRIEVLSVDEHVADRLTVAAEDGNKP
ncbi:MAG: hemolysin family protein [Acidimicrobiia bacterium]